MDIRLAPYIEHCECPEHGCIITVCRRQTILGSLRVYSCVMSMIPVYEYILGGDHMHMGYDDSIIVSDTPLCESRKQCLKENKSQLVENLNHVDVVQWMVDNGHMATTDKDRILCIHGEREAKLVLIEWLTEASIGAFNTLIDYTRKNDFFIYSLLTKSGESPLFPQLL